MEVRFTLYDVIDDIERDSARVLARESLIALSAYLHGFKDELGELGAWLKPESPPFYEFNRWVADRLGRGLTEEGWVRSIVATEPDDSKRLHCFFELLHEFRYSKASRSAPDQDIKNLITSRRLESIYDVVDRIRIRPGMFLGECSLSALDAYLRGARDGARMAGEQLLKEKPEFSQFGEWIAQKFERNETDWRIQIEAFSGNAEEALAQFFLLLDQYRRAGM